MKNDNSYEFWLNYYSKNFKEWCKLMMQDYNDSLIKLHNDFKKNYENRTDKASNNYIIKDTVKGLLNQIKAIEHILKLNL